MSAYQCPTCSSNDTRRLSIVYQGGLSDVNTTTNAVGFGRGGFASGTARTSGTSQTVESQAAAPPPQKRYVAGAMALGFALLTFLIAMASDGGALFFLIGLVSAGLGIWLLREARQYNRAVWPDLRKRWDATFKCFRCGNVFVFSDTTQAIG